MKPSMSGYRGKSQSMSSFPMAVSCETNTGDTENQADDQNSFQLFSDEYSTKNKIIIIINNSTLH